MIAAMASKSASMQGLIALAPGAGMLDLLILEDLPVP
jgi:hypothetical protein